MSQGTPNTSRPTVVLVHGAFADASSWNGVIERLQSHGVPVTAPANPLRGIVTDSAYTASLISQTDINLQKLSTRQLSSEEQETVAQIRKFVEQSKTADQDGDLPRAASLANKAKLLSEALIKP